MVQRRGCKNNRKCCCRCGRNRPLPCSDGLEYRRPSAKTARCTVCQEDADNAEISNGNVAYANHYRQMTPGRKAYSQNVIARREVGSGGRLPVTVWYEDHNWKVAANQRFSSGARMRSLRTGKMPAGVLRCVENGRMPLSDGSIVPSCCFVSLFACTFNCPARK